MGLYVPYTIQERRLRFTVQKRRLNGDTATSLRYKYNKMFGGWMCRGWGVPTSPSVIHRAGVGEADRGRDQGLQPQPRRGALPLGIQPRVG